MSLVRSYEAPVLSIILPAFNEQATIQPAVESIAERMAALDLSYEILVVDDGSTDATAERARRLAACFAEARRADGAPPAELRVIAYRPNRGKGHAVKTGVLESRGRFVLFMDADLSTSPAYIPAFLLEAASGWDLVAASRKLPDSCTDPPQGPVRRLASRAYNRLACLFLGLPPSTTDVSCGFKMFRGDAARGLFARQRLDGWVFDAEILLLARRAKLRTKELPVRWSNRIDSRVRVLRDAWRSLSEMLTVRLDLARGSYGLSELPVPAAEGPLASTGGAPLQAEHPAEAGACVGGRDARDLLGSP